jgi:TonB family protein
MPAIPLPEVQVAAGHAGHLSTGSGVNLWIVVYLSVTVMIMLWYAMSYLKLRQILNRGREASEDNYILILNTGIGPGTLGRKVFIPGEFCEPAIIAHEVAHIRAGHRYDLLLLLCIQCLCWMNPFAWIILRELKTVHELEADAQAASAFDRCYYQELLLSQAFSVPPSLLVHSFFNHPIKRRIIMLQNVHSSKRVAAITTAVLLTIVMVSGAVYAQTVNKKQSAKRGEIATADSLRAIKAVEAHFNDPQVQRQLKKELKNAKPVIIPDGRMVYKYVDQMPEFKGDLNGYLIHNLHYPDSARAHNQQGRSIVQFIVDENGKVVNPEIVRSSGVAVLDNEALRAVSEMPAWNPGKQAGTPVNVYFTMPISFKLD